MRFERRIAFFKLQLLCLAIALGSLPACTSTSDLGEYHARPGYDVGEVAGEHFSHRVVYKAGTGTRLHVYIEGDGRPWVTPTSRATDPTPRHPLLLDLMALDSAPALYLGRPCYFHTRDPACDASRWWTSHRYSPEVLDSMASVLTRKAAAYDSVVLIGHSGGGAMAFLLASRLPRVDTLVTLSANLDVDAWTRENRFSPLTGSLNPAQQPGLSDAIDQFHYWGSEDERVSRDVVAGVAAENPGARFIVLEGVDHNCCWQQLWPGILRDLQ